MKRSPFHIAFSLFIAVSLLFSQVGLGYFHDEHDAHEHIDQAGKHQTQLHKHGEHCKVCSIDLFSSLYVDNGSGESGNSEVVVVPVSLPENLKSLPLSFIKGRAPPITFL